MEHSNVGSDPARTDAYPFDRERTLAELLPPSVCEKLESCLQEMLGTPLCVIALDDSIVIGADLGIVSERCVITFDCEPLGYLVVPTGTAHVGAAVMIIELMVQSSARYQMAASLHQQVIQEDYQQLTAKHHALRKSEARYKALADELERRVLEQVKTIETAQRQLYQAEKLASVGQLAAGLAHEINNPMGFMTSNINTAQGYLERLYLVAEGLRRDGSQTLWEERWVAADLDFVIADFRDMLRESLSGAERVTKIVADLQGFSRVDAPSMEIADVNEIIRRVCNVSEAHLRGRATLKLELATVPSIRCHAGQLGQVLLNMLLNAVQALEKLGEIQFSSMVHADMILIKIRDTGPGIHPDILPRIFDPFFTTKQVGQGTGLGLTVCNDIVKSHGGRIDVDTTLGQGTTFTIVLPRGEYMGI